MRISLFNAGLSGVENVWRSSGNDGSDPDGRLWSLVQKDVEECDMRLQEFMSRDVEIIMMEESLEAAWQKMRTHRIRHLVAMNGNTVAGVLSERDIINLSPEEREGRRVQDVMESPAVTVGPNMTVREAANLMRGRTIGCLPVMEGRKLIGIITTTDLLQLLGQGVERVTGDTEKQSITREHPGRKQAGFNPKFGKT